MEYKTFIVGLKLVLALRAKKVKVRTDSQLVANHLNKSFQANDEMIKHNFKCSKHIMTKFKAVEIEQIPRAENFRADILAIMAAASDAKMPRSVPVEVKDFPSIKQGAKVMCLDTGWSWMDPIASYI